MTSETPSSASRKPKAPSDLCYLNGAVLPLAEARIDPLDRGFVFGDGLYDAIKVMRGKTLHLEPHLDRLIDGLGRVQIPVPAGLVDAFDSVIEANHLDEGSLYLQITRGVAPRSHVPPADLEPTVLVIATAHEFDPQGSRAMTAVTVPDWRWRNCNIKTTSLMATVLGKLAARDAECDEVLFVGRNGEVREGGSTNIMVRRADRLETYPLDGQILEGVTRGLVLELVRRDGLEVAETAPNLEQRDEWQEVLVTGTLTGVQAIVSLDGEPVGDGRIGDWARRLGALFATYEDLVAEPDGSHTRATPRTP